GPAHPHAGSSFEVAAPSDPYIASLHFGGGTPDTGTPPGEAFANATSGPPSALPHQAQMEHAFGTDFSGVQAHVGQAAALDGAGAHAAAKGDTVAFGPSSPSVGLVAHELTHVVQQRQSGTNALAASRIESRSDDAAEREADAIAGAVEGGAASVSVAAPPSA